MGPVDIQAKELIYTAYAHNDLIAKADHMNMNGYVQGNSTLSSPKLELGSQASFGADVAY